MPPGEIQSFVLRHPVAGLSHLMGFVWGVFVTALLWRLCRGDRTKQLSVACFGGCMTLLYLASGVYHSVQVPPEQLRIFRLIDHTAIYLLIAGTFTPILVVLLDGRLRATLLVLIWGCAAVGIACKWLLPAPSYQVTVALYVAMGWIGAIPAVQLVRVVGVRAMALGLLGGLFYTAGAIFDALHWPNLYPGVVTSHEILHVFDLLGTLCHVYFIVRYVVPYRRPASDDLVMVDPIASCEARLSQAS